MLLFFTKMISKPNIELILVIKDVFLSNFIHYKNDFNNFNVIINHVY